MERNEKRVMVFGATHQGEAPGIDVVQIQSTWNRLVSRARGLPGPLKIMLTPTAYHYENDARRGLLIVEIDVLER